MNTNIYTYQEYEEAYYHMRYYQCVTIGRYLLSRLKDNKSKQLLKELDKGEPSSQLLIDIRIWLMINQNFI